MEKGDQTFTVLLSLKMEETNDNIKGHGCYFSPCITVELLMDALHT